MNANQVLATNQEVSLKRGLKKHQVKLVALGGIIGSAYFLGSGYIINKVGLRQLWILLVEAL